MLLCATVGACGDGISEHTFPDGGYQTLSQTGLFADISAGELADDVMPYTTSYVLWSDGAVKDRYLRLPGGTQLDTEDPDHWELPIGGQVFKSFVRDGTLVETRLIERIGASGDREEDYWFGAFLWRDDGSDADFVEQGAMNGRGTEHDVPSAKACWRCHRGQPGALLGVGALQLSGDRPGATLSSLAEADLLSSPVPGPVQPPGEGLVTEALGYLHANCSHCHNPRGIARSSTDLDLELFLDDQRPEETNTYRTTINVELQYWTEVQDDFTYRVVPGEPTESGLMYRMEQRGERAAMPPIASELVHVEGNRLISDWISSL